MQGEEFRIACPEARSQNPEARRQALYAEGHVTLVDTFTRLRLRARLGLRGFGNLRNLNPNLYR
jgi:hypothetical protein